MENDDEPLLPFNNSDDNVVELTSADKGLPGPRPRPKSSSKRGQSVSRVRRKSASKKSTRLSFKKFVHKHEQTTGLASFALQETISPYRSYDPQSQREERNTLDSVARRKCAAEEALNRTVHMSERVLAEEARNKRVPLEKNIYKREGQELIVRQNRSSVL